MAATLHRSNSQLRIYRSLQERRFQLRVGASSAVAPPAPPGCGGRRRVTPHGPPPNRSSPPPLSRYKQSPFCTERNSRIAWPSQLGESLVRTGFGQALV